MLILRANLYSAVEMLGPVDGIAPASLLTIDLFSNRGVGA
jgi:hypothetical protein